MSVRRPAWSQQTVGAGKYVRFPRSQIEDAKVGPAARSDVWRRGKNHPASVRRPARIRLCVGVPLDEAMCPSRSIGGDDKDRAGVVSRAVDKGELSAVGRPADGLRIDWRLRELCGVAAVDVGSPQDAVREGDVGQRVGCPRNRDELGGDARQKWAGLGRGWIEAYKFTAPGAARSKERFAVPAGDGTVPDGRTVGELDRSRSHLWEQGFSVPQGPELAIGNEEVLSGRRPLPAPLGGPIAPTRQELGQVAAVRRDPPQQAVPGEANGAAIR